MLGGHVSFLKSTITYSRDSMARPIRVLEKLLQHVRIGYFRPDETRSGRFSNEQVPDDTEGDPLETSEISGRDSFETWEFPSEPVPTDLSGWELPSHPSEPLVISDDENLEVKEEVDDDGASSSGHETSSSSDESAAELSGARRNLMSPRIPQTP